MQPWSGKFNREREFMFCDNHQDITRHLFSGPSDLGTILPCPSGDCNKIDIVSLASRLLFSTIYCI